MKQIKQQFEVAKDKAIDTKLLFESLKNLPEGKYEMVVRKPTRTSKQNRALHKFFQFVAEALNEKHFYNKIEILDGVEVPWTPESVKINLWRHVQMQHTGKYSTASLTTSELSQTAEKLQMVLSSVLGINVIFPNIVDYINDVIPYEI